MKSVSQARAILMAIAVAFLLLDAGAVAVLMSPAGRSSAERGHELENLRLERIQKESETRPTRDMDKKLLSAREAIGGFYSHRLPASYSDISEDLGKLAGAQHVSMSQVRYETKPSPVAGLNTVAMNIAIAGDYRAVMEFINSLERDQRFYVLDRILIGDAGAGNQLRVELIVETYLRSGS